MVEAHHIRGGSPSVEVRPWVGVYGWDLGTLQQEGGSKGRGLGPGAQQAPQCLSGQGKRWPCSLPFLRQPPQGLPHRRWTPNRGWVPLSVETPPLPQPPLRGAGPIDPAFTFAPPSLPPTPSGPAWLEGASVGKGSGLGSQQAPGGPCGQEKPWPHSLLILCPPNGPPLSPPPDALQGHQSCLTSTSHPPSLPPCPTSYPVPGGSSCPLRCTWSPTGAW